MLLAGTSLILFAPHYIIPTTVQESVLIDKTDSFLVKPDATEILALSHIQDDKFKTVRLRIQSVSNVNYNPITSLELPAAIPLLSNPTERDTEALDFINRTKSKIDSINTLPAGLQHSSIYLNVIGEVNKMAAIEGNQKIVIVYSDLLENSPLFNMYNTKQQRLLKTNLISVKAAFLKALKPVCLKGIQVYFIFRPRTDAENDRFALIVNLYKTILEESGASVFIGGNLIEK